MSTSDNSLATLFDMLRSKLPGLAGLMASESESEFDESLEFCLENAADLMEKNANHLTRQDEEAISAFLVACLNMPLLLRATQEAHSNGHVDITVEAVQVPPFRRRLGEAKIYRGPSTHVAGLEQLLGRYTTGRDRSAFMVEYVKDPDIAGLVVKIRLHMDMQKPLSQDGESADHRIHWAFTTNHKHGSGEMLRVLHLNCNLYRSQ